MATMDINKATEITAPSDNTDIFVSEDGALRKLSVDALMSRAVPIIDAQSSSYDMDTILKSGVHCRFYKTNPTTLGTPYNKGVSSYTGATILSYASSTTYGYQIAFLSGVATPMMRRMAGGTIEDWTTGYLPLSGGTLTNTLTVPYSIGLKQGSDNAFRINVKNPNNTVTRGQITCDSSSTHRFTFYQFHTDQDDATTRYYDAYYFPNTPEGKTASAWYQILTTKNKPSGTYTGNGDATSRTIDTGGLGNVIMLIGNGYSMLVTTHGAIGLHYSTSGVVYLPASNIKFADGVLTIATTSVYVNNSGTSFKYQVL